MISKKRQCANGSSLLEPMICGSYGLWFLFCVVGLFLLSLPAVDGQEPPIREANWRIDDSGLAGFPESYASAYRDYIQAIIQSLGDLGAAPQTSYAHAIEPPDETGLVHYDFKPMPGTTPATIRLYPDPVLLRSLFRQPDVELASFADSEGVARTIFFQPGPAMRFQRNLCRLTTPENYPGVPSIFALEQGKLSINPEYTKDCLIDVLHIEHPRGAKYLGQLTTLPLVKGNSRLFWVILEEVEPNGTSYRDDFILGNAFRRSAWIAFYVVDAAGAFSGNPEVLVGPRLVYDEMPRTFLRECMSSFDLMLKDFRTGEATRHNLALIPNGNLARSTDYSGCAETWTIPEHAVSDALESSWVLGKTQGKKPLRESFNLVKGVDWQGTNPDSIIVFGSADPTTLVKTFCAVMGVDQSQMPKSAIIGDAVKSAYIDFLNARRSVVEQLGDPENRE